MTNPHYPFVTVPTKLKYENLDRPWTDLHYEADLIQISSGNVGLTECSPPPDIWTGNYALPVFQFVAY